MPLERTEPATSVIDAARSLAAALAGITQLTALDESTSPTASAAPSNQDAFTPIEPASFHAAGLTDCEVEALALKYLLARGDAAGREIADQLKLPFILVHELLQELKNQQIIGHRGSAPMNDFLYQLSELGRSAPGGTRKSAPTTVRRPSPWTTTSPAFTPSRPPCSIPRQMICAALSRGCY